MNWYRYSAKYYKTILYPKVDKGIAPHYNIAQISEYLRGLTSQVPGALSTNVYTESDGTDLTGDLEILIRTLNNDRWASEKTDYADLTALCKREVAAFLDKLEVLYEITFANSAIHANAEGNSALDEVNSFVYVTIEKNYLVSQRSVADLFGQYTPYLEIPSYILFTDLASGQTFIKPGEREWNTGEFLTAMNRNLLDNNFLSENKGAEKYIQQMVDLAQWCFDNGIEMITGNTIPYDSKESYPEEWIEAAADKIAKNKAAGGNFTGLPHWAFEILDGELKKDHPHPMIEAAVLSFFSSATPITNNEYVIPSLKQWIYKKLMGPNPPKQMTDFINAKMADRAMTEEWANPYIFAKLFSRTEPIPQEWLDELEEEIIDDSLPHAYSAWAERYIKEKKPETVITAFRDLISHNQILPPLATAWAEEELEEEELDNDPDGPPSVNANVLGLEGAPLRQAIYHDIRVNGTYPQWARSWWERNINNHNFSDDPEENPDPDFDPPSNPKKMWVINAAHHFFNATTDIPVACEKYVISAITTYPETSWAKAFTREFERRLNAKMMSSDMAYWIQALLGARKFPEHLKAITLEVVNEKLKQGIHSVKFNDDLNLIKGVLEEGNRTVAKSNSWYKMGYKT